MPSISDLRSMYPQYDDMSDGDIVTHVAQQNGMSIEAAADALGVAQNAPGFWSGLRSGLGGFAEGVGRVIDDGTDGKTGAITRYGRDVQFHNPSSAASQSWEGFKDNPWQGIKELAGSGIGSTLPSVAAFAIPGGQEVGAAGLLGRGLQVARTVGTSGVGQTLAAAAPIYGQVRNDQERQGFTGGSGEDIARAAAAALAGGWVESKLGINRLLNQEAGMTAAQAARQSLVNQFAETPLKTARNVMGRSALEEGAEELVQQPMQQWGAYQDPTTKESLKDTAWSGFGGVVGGLAMAPIGGVKMGMAHSKIDQYRQADLLNADTPMSVLDGQADWNRAFINRDHGQAAGDMFYNGQQATVDNFMQEAYANRYDAHRRDMNALHNQEIADAANRISPTTSTDLLNQINAGIDQRIANRVDRPNNWDYQRWWEGVPDPVNRARYEQFWGQVAPTTEQMAENYGATPDMFGGSLEGTHSFAYGGGLRDPHVIARTLDVGSQQDVAAMLREVPHENLMAVLEANPQLVQSALNGMPSQRARDLTLADLNARGIAPTTNVAQADMFNPELAPLAPRPASSIVQQNIQRGSVSSPVEAPRSAKASAATFNQPSGVRVSDPFNGNMERELTLGELSAIQAGAHQDVMAQWKAEAEAKLNGEGKNAAKAQPVVTQAVQTQNAKAQPKPAAAPAAQGVVQAPPKAGKKVTAFVERLNAAVAAGKIAPDHQLINEWKASKQNAADVKQFHAALDDAMAGPDVAVESPEAALARKAEEGQSPERKFVENILNTLPMNQRKVLELYHFDKQTFDDIGETLANEQGRDKVYSRQRIQQLHKAAVDKIKEEAAKVGVPAERIDQYFPNENNSLQGGADVQTASAAQVAQSGAVMHTPGEVNHQVNETEEVSKEELTGELDSTDDVHDQFDKEPGEAALEESEDVGAADVEANFVPGERDVNGNDIRPVDVEDALDEWNNLEDTPLHPSLHMQWTKLWIAHEDGYLKDARYVEQYLAIAQESEKLFGRAAEDSRSEEQPGRASPVSAESREGGVRQDGAIAEGQSVAASAAERSDPEAEVGEVVARQRGRVENFGELTNAIDDNAVRTLAAFVVDNIVAEGRGAMLRNVSDIDVHDKEFDQIKPNGDGTYAIRIGQASIKNGPAAILMGIEHEIAHAYDDYHSGNHRFSQSRQMGFVMAQAKQIYKDYTNGNKDNVVGQILNYPFADGLDPATTREEVFAQLMSIYAHPDLREELRLQSRLIYNFLEGVHNEARAESKTDTATKPAPAGNGTTQQPPDVRFRKGGAAAASQTFASVGQKLDELIADPKRFFKNLKLGFTTLEQIAEATKSAAVKTYHHTLLAMQKTSKDIVHQAALIDQKWAAVSKNQADFDRLNGLMTASTLQQFDPSKDKPSNDKQAKLAAEWGKLSKDAKALYEEVRDFFAGNLKLRHQIMEDMAVKAKLQGKELDKFRELYAKVKGPYFPLVRVGDYYAVGMSKRAAELMDKKDAGTLTSGEEAELEKLRKDPKQYSTPSFTTERAAKMWVRENSGRFPVTRYNVSEAKLGYGDIKLPGLPQMEAYVNADLPAEVRTEVKNMMARMVFDMAPEGSHLKRMMRREGIHGYEQDMRKAFANAATSQAHYISRLKHNTDVSAALVAVQKEGRNNIEMRSVYNELVERTKLAQQADREPVVDWLLNTSYFAHLGLSPAFVLTNMTQVPMISTPWLGARHGFGKASSALAAAYGDAYKVIKTALKDGGYRTDLEWGNVFKKGSDEDKLLTDLLDRNILNITIEHDLGVVAKMGGTSRLGEAAKLVDTPVRVTEYANRVVTALAAYRLARADKMSHEDAVEHAAKAVSQTQLNYSDLNAPRLMRSFLGSKSVGRLMFQFRKYQQGMLWLVAGNLADSFKSIPKGEDGKPITGKALEQFKAERAVARRFTLGMYGLMQLMAGTTGLPFIGTFGIGGLLNIIVNAFGDDDDPWDWEEALRNTYAEWFGDDVGAILSKGILMGVGVDISKRLGMADLANPVPFARMGNNGKETVNNVIGAMAGASVGTVADVIDGMRLMTAGEGLKAAEKIAPVKLAKDMARAVRYSEDGMTDTRGNVILPSEKFSPWDIALRASGFSPSKESEYYSANEFVQGAKQAAKESRAGLLREYSNAVLKGEDASDINAKIAEFNERHPEKGVKIDVSTKLKSVQQNRKMAQERTGSGLRTDKTTKPFLKHGAFADE